MQTKLLINGHLVEGEGPAQAVFNPALGRVLVEINEASEAQVDAAVRAADAAFEGWSQTAPKDRSLLLLKLADVIEAHGEELAKL
jgi:aminobutyraldehyde dehydrogenase